MIFLPTLVCLILWGLYTGTLQRWGSRFWRWTGIIALACIVLFVSGCAIRILLVLAKLLF